MSSSWQWVPGSNLKWRRWGDEYLAYNEASGSTHLLNADSALLLESLAGKSKTIDELRLTFPDFEPDEITMWLEESLKSFKQLGLVQLIKE